MARYSDSASPDEAVLIETDDFALVYDRRNRAFHKKRWDSSTKSWTTGWKAPYSALVAKDGSTVWAEDSDGKTIASGESGVDDASVIQSAIDACPNYGKIVLNAPTFDLHDSISISNKNYFQLEFIVDRIVTLGDFPAFIIDKSGNSIIKGNLRICRYPPEDGYNDTSYAIRILTSNSILVERINVDRTRNGVEIYDTEYAVINQLLVSVWGRGLWIHEGSHQVTVQYGQMAGRIESPGPGYAEDIGVLIENSNDVNFQYLYSKFHTTGLKTVNSNLLSGLYIVCENNHNVGLHIAEGCIETAINAVWTMGSPIGVLIEGSSDARNRYTRIGVINARYNSDIQVKIGNYVSMLNVDYLQTQGGNVGLQVDCPNGRLIHIGAFVPHQHDVADLDIVNAPAEGINIDYIRHAWNGIQGLPADIRVGYGEDFKNSGAATFSGDGTTTQFSIAHGLVSTPTKVLVTPMTADAASDFYVTADDTKIYINYKSAPPSGTDNLKFSWYAEV